MSLILKLMINRIKEHITNNNLFSRDSKLLLAISGGADSVCLFFVLKELAINFELAHCNFKLRGKESDEDEYFVKELADRYRVKCHVKSFETKQYSNKKKISIQMAARDLRYKWFDELLLFNNLDFVITAHHQDDNIETFLINLVRGTGINGLSGIKSKNNKVIRPLLEITRKEIEDYLNREGINYRNDSSNKQIKYLRNKIRHKLIPLLKEMNPNIKKTIIDEISFLSSVSNFFQQRVGLVRHQLLIQKNGFYEINISELMQLDPLEIFLFEILKPFGFSQIDQIIKAMRSQVGTQFFSEDYQLIVDREEIIISLLEKEEERSILIDIDFDIDTPLNLKFTTSFDFSIDNDENIAKLDFDKLSFPLKLRKWKNGDKFKPLGMRNFKKVSDFFIDEKYSLLDKKKQWILCSEDSIIWIVGNRIDDRYKIDTNTKKVYIAQLF
jgi:tRNA(Ile)-lysidine synthase